MACSRWARCAPSSSTVLIQPNDEQRYVYPLIAPPTPERLEQDKKTIEEQFDKAFALVEQLAKDTEDLKSAEQQRTERLDTALSELETVMADLKSANRRREDDAQRIREEVQSLKDAIPKAMGNQKDLTDNRLREINGELTSLKTLVSQRMTSGSSPAPASNYLRPTSGNANGANRSATPAAETPAETSSSPAPAAPAKSTTPSSFNRMSNGGSTGGKASIPAWQMAMANQNGGGSSTSATVEDASPSGQNEASGSA